MSKYKVSFVFDDTNSEFDVDAFMEVTTRDAREVGQEITDVKVEEVK